MAATAESCPHCDIEALVIREPRVVPSGQRRVEIDDEYLRCPQCGEDFYSSGQAEQRHRRAIEKCRAEDNLLSPSQIKGIREELTLTQRQFESLLGVGEKTCVRWENGRVCQNVTTDRLIRLLAANRTNVRVLAGINCVSLPDSCLIPASGYQSEKHAGWNYNVPLTDLRPMTNVSLSGTSEAAFIGRDIQGDFDPSLEQDIRTQEVSGQLRDAATRFDDLFAPTRRSREHS